MGKYEVIKPLAFVLLLAILLGSANVLLNSAMAQGGVLTIDVIAPIGGGIRPYEDGVMIAGRTQGYNVLIQITNVGNESLKDVEIYGDAYGDVVEGPEVHLSPRLTSTPNIVTPNESRINGAWLEQENMAYFKIDEIKPGETWKCYYSVNVPQSVPEEAKIKLTIKIVFDGNEQIQYKYVKIVPPPMWRQWLVIGLTAVTFGSLIFIGKRGWFKFYTNVDLVTISMLAAAQVVWVQIIGRQLVFPALNRIPLTYNFAVGDFPYILLLITAVMLVRKPGTVSLTLFVYNIVSEIGWYGLNPLWWAYPFAEGLPADLYLLIRGRATFTEKLSFFKVRAEQVDIEKLEVPTISFLPLIDGAMIGFLRGFFMQLSLYLVFYPNLFHIYYAWGYAFWWMTIPWSIGNAIEGAISVPIAKKIEEAVQY